MEIDEGLGQRISRWSLFGEGSMWEHMVYTRNMLGLGSVKQVADSSCVGYNSEWKRRTGRSLRCWHGREIGVTRLPSQVVVSSIRLTRLLLFYAFLSRKNTDDLSQSRSTGIDVLSSHNRQNDFDWIFYGVNMNILNLIRITYVSGLTIENLTGYRIRYLVAL